MNITKNNILKIAIVMALPLIISGCAPKVQSVYSGWGQKLSEVAYNNTSVDDVSFMLGTPPIKCEPVEPTPKIGIMVNKIGPPEIGYVVQNSPANKAGIKVKDIIKSIDNISITSGKDFHGYIKSSIKWGKTYEMETDKSKYSIMIEKPIDSKQCYWEITAGGVGRSSGGAYVDNYGGVASHSSAAYQRFFRASCRFNEGYAIECSSNWQE